MKLLLDTHVLLWLAEGLEDLAPAARRRIDGIAARSGLAVSAISFWEVAMLENRGRISISTPVEEWKRMVLGAGAIVEVPLDGAIGIEAVRLPGTLHGDPADRMIVATARRNGWRLATRDERILDYGEAGHVAVLRV